MELYNLYQFENGAQLLSYAGSLSNEEKIESQCKVYSDEFAKVYQDRRLLPHQFTIFAYALRKLSLEQSKTETKQLVNNPSTGKASDTNKSQACEII